MNNLNLIIGEDNELVNFYLFDILKKIDFTEDNKINYDLSTSTLTDILDESSMMSLFADTKVIIGHNFNIGSISENDFDYLTKYTNNPNKSSYIILLAPKVDARVKEYKIFKEKFNVIDISKSNNKDNLYDYLKKTIADKGYKIDSSNLDYLLSKLGNDINNINSELNKLLTYKDEDKYLDRDTIDLLITDNIDNIIYEFTNAIFDNDYDKITKMYNNFKIENIGYDYLIASLSNSFRQSLIIKILHNKGESNINIAKKIGKKEFYVKKSLERLYYYTTQDLSKFINKLSIIDRDYKSGKNNLDMLEFFILNKEK